MSCPASLACRFRIGLQFVDVGMLSFQDQPVVEQGLNNLNKYQSVVNSRFVAELLLQFGVVVKTVVVSSCCSRFRF